MRGVLKHIVSPEQHENIKRAYQTMTGNGEVKKLAKKINLPRWKISKYALKNGWIATHSKMPDWTKRELKILEKNAHRPVEFIYKKLKKEQFHRTETAIVLKRKRMRFAKNLEGQSATGLAECFGVDGHTITKAIKDGKLKADKRDTKRTALQGGDTWYIKDKDVRSYILNYLPEIDLRKVDKYWFVDVLSPNRKGNYDN